VNIIKMRPIVIKVLTTLSCKIFRKAISTSCSIGCSVIGNQQSENAYDNAVL
ncbi:hypothetical protein L9F63_001512, partial [Diploptera punctata]